jgi:sugar phosphate isomerase/epimerase
LEDGSVIVAGAGYGEVVETMHALHDDGFDGFFSLEPHLRDTSSPGGFSGPELFTQAWKAFTDLLNREGIPYA